MRCKTTQYILSHKSTTVGVLQRRRTYEHETYVSQTSDQAKPFCLNSNRMHLSLTIHQHCELISMHNANGMCVNYRRNVVSTAIK